MKTDNAETSPISMLPEDVLLEIFDFLKHNDRNNAKLVCKSWLQILKYVHFTGKEIFFFPPYYDLSTIVRVVDECCFDELNLKFENRQFQAESKFFWEQCGQKMKSLKFSDCSFHPDLMSQIFEYCVNLEEFIADRYCDISYLRRLEFPKKSFKKFKVDQFAREKLWRLEFGPLPHSVSDLIFIASVFPNLKTLGVSLMENVDGYFCELQNLLETQKLDIKKLHVHLPDYIDSEDVCEIQKFISSNRTVEVTLSMNFDPELFKDTNIQRISPFESLTSLILEPDFENTDATLVARLVDELPKLQHLAFFLIFTAIPDYCIIWSALMKSHLISITCSVILEADEYLRDSFHEIDSSLNSLTRNYTVRRLILRYDHPYSHSDECVSLILKYFQRVNDLEMWDATPTTIFQCQTQLQSLKLQCYAQLLILSPNEISSQSISIESIQHLDVSGYAIKLFWLYRFPNLKYLTLNFELSSYEKGITSQRHNRRRKFIRDSLRDDIQKLASILRLESPKLTAVDLCGDCNEMKTFEFFLQFCRNFKNLRYVHISCDVGPRKAALARKVIGLVNLNLSIKVVWIEVAGVRLNYFFNHVEGRYEFSREHHEFVEFSPIVKDLWKNNR